MNFGAWLGLVFPENDGLGRTEVTVYYVEHLMGASIGTLVLSACGRFDILSYASGAHMLLGHMYFIFYMRFVLTPVSMLTWANLNHNLCAAETDLFA